MPSLKMKTKLNRSSLVGKSDLHVCQKSSIISKNSFTPVRISQYTAELENCTEDCQDVCSSTEVSSWNSRNAEFIDLHEFLGGENFQLQPQTPFFVDPTIMGIMDFALPSSQNFGTIFSPILKSGEIQSELNILVKTDGKNDAHLPQLKSDDSDDSSGKYYDNKSCNISDFIISDMNAADVPFNENTMYDKILDTNPFPDFRCVAQDLDQEKSPGSHFLTTNIPDLSERVLSTTLLKEKQSKHITLVLDLDETLVHSTLACCDDADFTFQLVFNMKEYTVYVKRRPYLQTFLERVAEMFEIIVFTASQSLYARQLLNVLDPDGKLISRRFYRESCIISDGRYTKDLTVLGVDLAKIAIIDNSPQVFRLQVSNGIPIKSWFDDPSDNALSSLLPFLEILAAAKDVRPIIAKKFGHKE